MCLSIPSETNDEFSTEKNTYENKHKDNDNFMERIKSMLYFNEYTQNCIHTDVSMAYKNSTEKISHIHG